MREYFETSLRTEANEDDLRQLFKKLYKLKETPNVKVVSQSNLASVAQETNDEIVMAQTHVNNSNMQLNQPPTPKNVVKPRTMAGKSQPSESLLENDGMQSSSSEEDGDGGVVNIRVVSSSSYGGDMQTGQGDTYAE